MSPVVRLFLARAFRRAATGLFAVAVMFAVVVSGLSAPTATAAIADSTLNAGADVNNNGREGTGTSDAPRTRGRWIVDELGRVLISHGVNMVAKEGSRRPEDAGFGEADAAFLAENGFDSVRLGVIWAAVEPQPGVYDDDYLASIARTVEILHAHGIRTLLDSHQDMYNVRFQGGGAPDWAVTATLPAFPLAGFPTNQFITPALMQQYDDLYANAIGPGGVGLADRFAAMWGHVAAYFASTPGILGYDLLNEPWAGYNWLGCMSSLLCGQQAVGLGNLYAKAGAAIRAVDKNHIVFYSPFSTANSGLADAVAPAPFPNSNEAGNGGQALSFHAYCIPSIQFGSPLSCDITDPIVMDRALSTAAAADAATMLTEFGAKKDPSTIQPTLDAADAHLMGWQYWHYCNCDDPTTSGPGEQGLVDHPSGALVDLNFASLAEATSALTAGGNVDWAKLDALSRPYPRATSGTPTFLRVDSVTKRVSYEYTPFAVDGTGMFPTDAISEFVVPPRWFPHGYTAHVTGGRVVAGEGSTVLSIMADGSEAVTLELAAR